MNVRIDIAKCDGMGKEICKTCTRFLAPAGSQYQAWTAPHEKQDGCTIYADIKKYGHLYGKAAA